MKNLFFVSAVCFVVFGLMYLTAEPLKVKVYSDGSKYVVETSQGKCFRPLTEMDKMEGYITYVE
jgi:hypothetical protein